MIVRTALSRVFIVAVCATALLVGYVVASQFLERSAETAPTEDRVISADEPVEAPRRSTPVGGVPAQPRRVIPVSEPPVPPPQKESRLVAVPTTLSPIQALALERPRAAAHIREAANRAAVEAMRAAKTQCPAMRAAGPTLLELSFDVETAADKVTVSSFAFVVKKGAPVSQAFLDCVLKQIGPERSAEPRPHAEFLIGLRDRLTWAVPIGDIDEF
jgi:hypothetical protein